MQRTQKWICDEAVTWWAAYTRNKPAPPRYCSSPLHVSICMANSHTGGCMRPQGLIHDRLGLSNVCFQTLRCSPLLVCCASLHLGWSIHSPASLLLLWPCDPPPPRPLQRVHSTSQHCSSTYHFLVSSYFYFLFSFVQCKNSSGHLQTLFPSHTDWFELVELNLGGINTSWKVSCMTSALILQPDCCALWFHFPQECSYISSWSKIVLNSNSYFP